MLNSSVIIFLCHLYPKTAATLSDRAACGSLTNLLNLGLLIVHVCVCLQLLHMPRTNVLFFFIFLCREKLLFVNPFVYLDGHLLAMVLGVLQVISWCLLDRRTHVPCFCGYAWHSLLL